MLDFDYTTYPKPLKKHRDTFIYGLMDDLVEAGMKGSYSRSVAGAVCELMSNQDLYYHNYIHPLAMFSFAAQNGIKLSLTERLAVWFHDAIYVPHNSENEELSSNIFNVLCSDLDVNLDEVIYCIDETGFHLRDHNMKCNAKIMDLDLHSFAFSYDKFKHTAELVQKELGTTPQQTIGFYKALLNRAPIFRGEEFSRFEETAQTNIQTYIEEYGNVI